MSLKTSLQDFFIETAEVYCEHYGTSKDAVHNILKQKHDVILNIEWQGARRVRELFKGQVCSIFVMPPSLV